MPASRGSRQKSRSKVNSPPRTKRKRSNSNSNNYSRKKKSKKGSKSRKSNKSNMEIVNISNSWEVGDLVRPEWMRFPKDIYEIVGEEGDNWLMYGWRGRKDAGGYYDGQIPKSVESGKLGPWEKVGRIMKRRKNTVPPLPLPKTVYIKKDTGNTIPAFDKIIYY